MASIMNQNLTKTDILDYSKAELAALSAELGLPGYRSDQLYGWLFNRSVDSFDQMTNLPKKLRAQLADRFTIDRLEPETIQTSKDGTRKFLFRLADGEAVEAVLIPERDHHTLCLSSQVGCAMGCKFCFTAAGGLTRNLTPGEIIGQIQAARAEVDEDKPLTNLVFMGMGEPLANFDNLIQAIGIITDQDGLGFSWRRTTVSTSGLAPRIGPLLEAVNCRLAVSLNAPEDEIRSQIMPINRTYPLAELISACREADIRRGERITFEYVLLAGVNDSLNQAAKLVKLLAPVPAKINLIPFNEHPASPFKRPDAETVLAFQNRLIQSNLTAMIRRSMGADILAACGQLRGQAEKTT